MQINREEVYTIQLCEHMLVQLRSIIAEFIFVNSNPDDEYSVETEELISFARSFMFCTDPDEIG